MGQQKDPKITKGTVCRIQGDLWAKLESNIHSYVFSSVLSPETMNHCVFLRLE